VRRFLKHLAVYFGLAEDDEAGSDPPSAPRSAKALAIGGVLAGATFALLMAAVGGFEDSVGEMVARGLLFGAAMTVFWYFIDRAQQRGDGRSPDEEPFTPASGRSRRN
jgi:hypothetical protein